MSKARLVITAVVTEGRSQGEVARAYGVSQGWVSRLVARYGARARQRSSPGRGAQRPPWRVRGGNGPADQPAEAVHELKTRMRGERMVIIQVNWIG
jgi:hypothetical protein